MSLQIQHVLLSDLKTLSVGPSEVRTHDLPHGSGALPTDLTGRRSFLAAEMRQPIQRSSFGGREFPSNRTIETGRS